MADSTLAAVIAQTVQARINCAESGNTEWHTRHTAMLVALAKEYLPSGSGIDNGTTIDLDRSTGDRLVLLTAFHHMDQHGSYDGWTEHTVYVTPTFGGDGVDVDVRGRNRNDIKNYLADVFRHALTRVIPTEEITAIALRVA